MLAHFMIHLQPRCIAIGLIFDNCTVALVLSPFVTDKAGATMRNMAAMRISAKDFVGDFMGLLSPLKTIRFLYCEVIVRNPIFLVRNPIFLLNDR
jgi:hypothetical protein